MNYRALFGVAVRTLGLVLIWYGIYDAFWALLQRADVPLDSKLPSSTHAIFAAFYILFGLAVVRGAGWIVTFAYGMAAPLSKNEEA